MSSSTRGTIAAGARTLVSGSTSVRPWSGSSGLSLSTQTSLLDAGLPASKTLASPPISGRYVDP